MRRTHLFLLVCALLAACGSASAPGATPQSPTPGAAPTAASPPTPGISPTEARELEATTAPVASGPAPLRDDISIRPIIETGGGFVRIAVDPQTKAIYYMDAGSEIYRLDVQPGEGSKGTRVYRGTDVMPGATGAGMAFGPDGTLYVVGNRDSQGQGQAIIRKGVPGESDQRTWSTLATTALHPLSGTQFDHRFNGIAASPDGRFVYVNSGSRTDHGEVQSNKDAFPNTREVPLTSAIFRIPADATDLTLPDDEAALREGGYLFADGLRNAFDPEFSPDGELFAGDNGPDADYPDELNWIREGRHYGFPWRFGVDDNPQQFPNYDAKQDRRLHTDFFAVAQGMYRNDPEFPKPPGPFSDPVTNLGPDGDQYRDADGSQKDASDQRRPLHTFTPHRSPLGLAFDSAGALSEFKGDAFILSWGAAGGSLTDRGEDLLHLDLTKEGDNYQARVTQIARDFDHPIDSVLIGTKLYVLDFGGAGTIWEVTLP